MAEVTLDQILAAPDDPAALQRHMSAIGLIAPPVVPMTGPTAPLSRPNVAAVGAVPGNATVAPMTPPARLAGVDNHPNAAPLQPMPADPNIATGTPAGVETPGTEAGGAPMQLKPLNFKERQSLPLGEPGTRAYYRSEIERQADQAAHPWGRRVFDVQGNEVKGEENHPGVLGKIGHVLAKVGNIAGDIVAPGTMALIPGTDLNKRGAYHEEERALQAQQGRETAADLAKARQAHELNIEQQAEDRLQQGDERLKQGAERVEQGDRRTTAMENRTPAAIQELNGMMAKVNPETGKNYTADEAQVQLDKEIAAVRHQVTQGGKITDAQANERYRQIQADQRAGKPIEDDDKYWAQGFEKLKSLAPQFSVAAQQPNKDRERVDRSFQLMNTEMEKKITPVEQASARLGRLRDTLAQGTPQADALIAPELLSIVAGGPGSGIRNNEAEIARIVGGRSNWENLKANLQKWSLDPASARSITPDQQAQIGQLVEYVASKIQQKLLVADEARSDLIGAESVQEHRKIVKNLEQQFDEIDNPHVEEENTALGATPDASGGRPKPKHTPVAVTPKRQSVADWQKQKQQQQPHP